MHGHGFLFLTGLKLLYLLCVAHSPRLSPVNVSRTYALYCYICACISAVAISIGATLYVCWVHTVTLSHITTHTVQLCI